MKMPRVELAEPTQEDLEIVAREMREADSEETGSEGYTDPLAALEFSVKSADYSRGARIQGKPLAMFGLTEHGLLNQTGSPWILSTHLVAQHPVAFMKAAKAIVEHMQERCPRGLWAIIDREYLRSIEWVKRLGFVVIREMPHPTTGETFVLVWRS